MAGSGQLHIQPVAVLVAGESDQRPPPGQALGAMPGGGIRQIDPAVALTALAAVQIPAGQGHLPRLLPLHPDRQGTSVGVKGGDRPPDAVGHPELTDRVSAADHPVPDCEGAVLDLEAVLAEVAAGGQ